MTLLRYRRSILFLALDVLVFIAALFSAYWLRFNGTIPAGELVHFFQVCFAFALVKVVLMAVFKVYSNLWEYMDITSLINLGISLFIASALIVVVSILFFQKSYLVPRSVIIIDLILSVIFAVGHRYVIKVLLKRFRLFQKKQVESPAKNIMIYGAGEAGSMVLKEIAKYPDLHINIIGFLDDDEGKWGLRINNKKVLGGLTALKRVYQNQKFDELIIAMPTASGSQVRRIIDECAELKSVEIKIVPGTKQIIQGEVKWNHIRDVAVEDLLGREEIVVNSIDIFKYIQNRTVLITGAGGSIGSELVRQCIKYKPKQLILLGKGENSIYQIENEIQPKLGSSTSLVTYIVDVRDKPALEEIFEKNKIDIVFHAAAHKHVPLMEKNPKEAFKNNIIGSWNLLDVAASHKIRKFVLISTDKAVNPTSIMGATKRVAEILLRLYAKKHPYVAFTAVRFGNVLGSRGSVVPLFKRQIQEGGPVTVTHKDVVRYFMTIPEAVSLVMQSGAAAKGGEIFVLDMGKPVNIYELAINLIRLSGLKPHEDIKIKVTGLRPGEKLYEEIMTEAEGIESTKNKKIFVARPEKHDPSVFDAILKLQKRLPEITALQMRSEIFKLNKY